VLRALVDEVPAQVRKDDEGFHDASLLDGLRRTPTAAVAGMASLVQPARAGRAVPRLGERLRAGEIG
jgi:hypothetical protein